MAKKRGRGRPPKPKGEKQSERIVTFMTPAEAKRLRNAAASLEMTPSDLLIGLWRNWLASRED